MSEHHEDLVRHVMERQVRPQLLAARMRAVGEDVEVAKVRVAGKSSSPEFDVACFGCGRTAKLPFQPPAGKVLLCPECQQKMAVP